MARIEPAGAIAIARAEPLRVAPEVDDTPAPANTLDEDNYDRSTTLRGNVVAELAAGAHGVLLAGRGDWRFVAIALDASVTKTSLRHGMFERYDERTAATLSDLPAGTLLCGWVRATALTAGSRP